VSEPTATATPPRVLAVDGNSLGHRAYHSSRDDDIGDDEVALTTGAIVSMLATAWRHGPYDALIIGFDSPDNRRKQAFPEYKAGRPPTPPALTTALELARGHLDACGLVVVEHDGAEADDVLAAATDACEARGWRCDLLSSDRDLTALVGPLTRLLRPRSRFADLEVEDVAQVRKRYGVEPAQYVDLAALRGDPSDGLRGATGIGPKIAARLLRDHGSVPALYTMLHDLPPKVEASLREARERVERNLELMAPIPHLAVDVEAALARGFDVERIEAVLDGLGVGAAARRFTRAVTDPSPALPPMPPPPDEEYARAGTGHLDAATAGSGAMSGAGTGAHPGAARQQVAGAAAAVRDDVADRGEQTALF
jgi:DNA polymerase I